MIFVVVRQAEVPEDFHDRAQPGGLRLIRAATVDTLSQEYVAVVAKLDTLSIGLPWGPICAPFPLPSKASFLMLVLVFLIKSQRASAHAPCPTCSRLNLALSVSWPEPPGQVRS
jgi:hypothetical protein